MSGVHMHLDSTVGLMFMTDLFSAILMGFALCQTYVYFTQYPKDLLFVKLLVAVTLVCQVVHQGLVSYTLYWYTITNFNEPDVFTRFHWSLSTPCIPNWIAVVLVQGFFLFRIWHINKKARLLTIPLAVMVLLEISIAMVVVAKSLSCKTFEEFANLKNLAMGPMTLAAVIDVSIAVMLVWALHHSRTGIKRTDTMINTLILFTMSTGAVTAVWAVATFISITLTGISFIVIFFYYCLGRLYFVSLLTSLNARQSIQSAGTENTLSFFASGQQSPLTVVIDRSIITSVEETSIKTKFENQSTPSSVYNS